jgi:predicted transcriptional regulator of viral defense system
MKPVMTLATARSAGMSKDRVYRMAAVGDLERVGRGVYVSPEVDPAVRALAGATMLKPAATMCLTSALVHHELSDEIPVNTDIALPRGTRNPAGFDHVTWHRFDPATFELGRRSMTEYPDIDLWVYSPERTLVDAFRLAYLEGEDQATEALRRWVRWREASPTELLKIADSFPRAAAPIRRALQVLL